MTSRDKAALRAAMLLGRSRLDGEAAARGLAAHASGLGPVCGLVVAGYWPSRNEIDPRLLMAHLASAGARLALPVARAPARSALLEFRLWGAGDPLRRSRFGIEEPLPEAPATEPDVLLVPLLAFDRSGGRLGYGAGYYDRTLRALRSRGRRRVIGLAFAAQEVEEVPMNEHDELLDEILTDEGRLIAGRAA